MHKQAILVTGSRMVGSRPPTLLFCTRGACLPGWRHAVDIIPDIGNIMHTTMQAMHIHKSHPAIVRAAAFNNLVKKSQVQSHAFIFYSSLTLF